MDAFKALKSACNSTKAYKSFNDIKVGDYFIHEFKFIQTCYGRKVACVTESFVCFLPERFSKMIASDEAIEALNKDTYIMRYSGKDAARRNLVMLDFVKCPTEIEDLLQFDEDAVVAAAEAVELQEAVQHSHDSAAAELQAAHAAAAADMEKNNMHGQ